jgi:hypothetical protein
MKKKNPKKLRLSKETISGLEYLGSVVGGVSGGVCFSARHSCFDTCESNQVCEGTVTSIEIGCPV